MISFAGKSPDQMWAYISDKNPTRIDFYSCSCYSSGSVSDPCVEKLKKTFQTAVKTIGRDHEKKGHPAYDLKIDVYKGQTLLASGKWTIAILGTEM